MPGDEEEEAVDEGREDQQQLTRLSCYIEKA